MRTKYLLIAVMICLIYSKPSLADWTATDSYQPELGNPSYRQSATPSQSYNGGRHPCENKTLISAQQKWIWNNRYTHSLMPYTIVTYSVPNCQSECVKLGAGEFQCSSCDRIPQGLRPRCSSPRKTIIAEDRLRFNDRLIADRKNFACDLSMNRLHTDWRYQHELFLTRCDTSQIPDSQFGIMYFCVTKDFSTQPVSSFAEFVRGCNTNMPGYYNNPPTRPYRRPVRPSAPPKQWWDLF